MHTIRSLAISGFHGRSLTNHFFRQDGDSDWLALVLPGMGYSVAMPLLYYPTLLLLDLGADVLQVSYDLDREPAYQRAAPDMQRRWLAEEAAAAYAAGQGQRAYRRVTLIGKSLGTLAMADLLPQMRAERTECVWLTPLLRHPDLRAAIHQHPYPSLFAIGTADPLYDPALLDDLRHATSGETLVFEGADHSLLVGGDLEGSLSIMERLIGALRGFLAPSA
jgi:dienelactone hydrolase